MKALRIYLALLFVVAAAASGLAAASTAGTSRWKQAPAPALQEAAPRRALALAGRAQTTSVQGTFLTSGDPVTFRLPGQPNPRVLFNQGYRIFVPSGATELNIELEILTPGGDLDLFVRFGEDVVVDNNEPVSDFASQTPGDGTESVTVPSSGLPLQSGFYFIGLGMISANTTVFGRITATVTGGDPQPFGVRLSSGIPQEFSIPPVDTPGLAIGELGFHIDVPQDASRLRVRATVEDPDASIRIFLRHGFDIFVSENGQLEFDRASPGGSNDETVTISTTTSPSLLRGTYWIGLGLNSTGTPFNGTVTATVETSQEPPPSIGLSRSQLPFNAVEGENPPPQSFSVSNEGGGTLSFTVSDNQPWVMVSPTSGSSSGAEQPIEVSVNTAGLAVGTHNAAITVEQTGGDDEATVSVTLNLSSAAPPGIALSTDALSFELREGSSPSPENPENTRSFRVRNAGGGQINYRVSADQPWLTPSPSQGVVTSEEDDISVVIDPRGLTPGVHQATVTVEDQAQGLEASVAVTLTLLENRPVPVVTTDFLRFEAEAGGAAPEPQFFSVGNSGGGVLEFLVEPSEEWIDVNPANGTLESGFDQIRVTVDISGLEPGTSAGEIVVREASASLGFGAAQTAEARVDVIVNVTDPLAGGMPPQIAENAVVNAASFVPFGEPGHATAPGSIVSIFGVNISGEPRQAGSIPLPLAVEGVSVTLDGIPAPLFFVSPGQINAQLPSRVRGTEAAVVVRNGAGESVEREIQINAVSPGVFTVSQQGAGQGIVTFANSTDLAAPESLIDELRSMGANASGRPAGTGDLVTIWCAGLGPVMPAIEDGRNSFDEDGFQLRETVSQPQVLIGGEAVPSQDVLFSGLAPEFVGLYQVNIRLADDLPRGDAVSVQLRIGGVESRPDVTFAIE